MIPKRSQILDAFYKKVLASLPPPDSRWRKAEKYPLLRVTPQECPAFYVFDFQEQVIEEAKNKNDLVRAKVFIVLEIFVQHTLSVNPSDMLNLALQPIQSALLGDTLGGLVQRVSEVGSKFKVESAENRLVSAEVAFYATYFRKAGE